MRTNIENTMAANNTSGKGGNGLLVKATIQYIFSYIKIGTFWRYKWLKPHF